MGSLLLYSSNNGTSTMSNLDKPLDTTFKYDLFILFILFSLIFFSLFKIHSLTLLSYHLIFFPFFTFSFGLILIVDASSSSPPPTHPTLHLPLIPRVVHHARARPL